MDMDTMNRRPSSTGSVHNEVPPTVLPEVHTSQVALPSPKIKAVFEDWKDSAPKLYKYPSSQLEVIVRRKSGEVQKIKPARRTKKTSREGNEATAAVEDNRSAAQKNMETHAELAEQTIKLPIFDPSNVDKESFLERVVEKPKFQMTSTPLPVKTCKASKPPLPPSAGASAKSVKACQDKDDNSKPPNHSCACGKCVKASRARSSANEPEDAKASMSKNMKDKSNLRRFVSDPEIFMANANAVLPNWNQYFPPDGQVRVINVPPFNTRPIVIQAHAMVNEPPVLNNQGDVKTSKKSSAAAGPKRKSVGVNTDKISCEKCPSLKNDLNTAKQYILLLHNNLEASKKNEAKLQDQSEGLSTLLRYYRRKLFEVVDEVEKTKLGIAQLEKESEISSETLEKLISRALASMDVEKRAESIATRRVNTLKEIHAMIHSASSKTKDS